MEKIRYATKEDALKIAIVNVYTWKTQYSGLMSEEVIDERVNTVTQMAEKIKARMDEDNKCIVLEVDNTIIGFCRYGKSRNEEYKNCGEIYALYLLKGFSKRGYGRKLFEKAVEDLKADGFERMIINCLKGNPTLDFYKHMGGEVVGKDALKINEDILEEDVLLFNI